MKDKLINDYEGYLQKSRIKNIRMNVNGNEVHIIASILSYKILIDFVLLALAIYGTYDIDDKSFYLIPILIVWAALIVVIWIDFKPINNIKIDLLSKKIQVMSRNIFQQFLRYILKKEKQFDFDRVTSFIVRSNNSFEINFLRYFIDMEIKNEPNLILTSFTKEEQAHSFARFLTSLIKN